LLKPREPVLSGIDYRTSKTHNLYQLQSAPPSDPGTQFLKMNLRTERHAEKLAISGVLHSRQDVPRMVAQKLRDLGYKEITRALFDEAVETVMLSLERELSAHTRPVFGSTQISTFQDKKSLQQHVNEILRLWIDIPTYDDWYLQSRRSSSDSGANEVSTVKEIVAWWLDYAFLMRLLPRLIKFLDAKAVLRLSENILLKLRAECQDNSSFSRKSVGYKDDRMVLWFPSDSIDYDVICAELPISLGPNTSVTRGMHPKVKAQA